MRRALAALLLIPLLDALLLVVVATTIGWELTVALVVLSALVGLVFVRAEGRRTLRGIQASVARGDQPTDELVDGALLLVAGAFLLTPGLVTDALGAVLVIPPTRVLVRTLLKRYVLVPYLDERTGGFVTGDVYVGGFPGEGGPAGPGQEPGTGPGPGSGPGPGPRRGGGSDEGEPSDDTYDLGEDAYDVEFDDEDESRSG